MTDADTHLQTLTDAHLASLVAVALRDDTTVYASAFGSRYIGADTHLPATLATKFRIASISKAVVAIAVMQLVEGGALDLDRDVSDYLGFALRNPHHAGTAITARTLLTHTSSLRDGSIYSIPLPYTLRDFFLPTGAFYRAGEHFALTRIGQDFAYCNLNYGVLGSLIEIASGERFDQYMQAHILRPLGLDASFGVHHLSDAGIAQLATLYRKHDGTRWTPAGAWVAQVDDLRGVRPQALVRVENPDTGDTISGDTSDQLADYTLGSNGTLFSPQGGLRISAPDLARIMRVLLGGGTVADVTLLKPTTVQAMLTVNWAYDGHNGDPYGGLMRAWGLGLHHSTATTTADGRGDAIGRPPYRRWWGHSGEAYGLLSGMWFDPLTNAGMVYMLGGVADDPDAHSGAYSSFTRWEEQIMATLCDQIYAS